MVTGVQIKYDHCLGINDKHITNQLSIIGENYIVFTAGSTLVVKDQNQKTQKILSYENKLRNMTALDLKVDKTNKMIITIGESSIDDNSTIGVHVVFPEENEWKFITCDKIYGQVKIVQTFVEKKQTIALVYSTNDQPMVFLWNFSRDKELAKIITPKIQLKSISFHPKKNKTFLFFSPSHLRLWDYTQQGKTFVEDRALVNTWTENESKFLDYRFLNNRYFTFLLVLCSDNTILWFQNEMEKKNSIRLDLSALPIMIVEPVIWNTKEVDETFGFGNVLEGKLDNKDTDIYDNEQAYRQKIKKHEIGGTIEDVPDDTKIKKFTTFRDGFVLGATGGVIAYFQIDNFDKIKEQVERISLSNPQNYLIRGFQDSKKIKFISVNKKFSLTTLVVKDQGQLDYYLISEIDVKDELNKMGRFFRGGFHRSKVKSLGVSLAKSNFITVGQDDVIRLWTYNSIGNREKGGVLYSESKESPLSVSIHPYGLFVAVAYSSGFKVFTLLKDNFFLLKEKNLIHCNHVMYSEGGQYIISSNYT